mgnify:CR=1 FL=1
MSKKVFLLGSVVGGVILVIVLFFFVDFRQIFSQIGEAGPAGIGAFTLNIFLIFLLDSISWKIILNSYGYFPPFKDILSAKLVGFTINYLTPSMYIGGEPLRTYMIAKKNSLSITRVGATVIVNKFLELGAALFFIYLGSIWTLIEYKLPREVFIAVLIANIIFGIGIGMIFVSFLYQKKFFTPLIKLIQRVKFFSKPLEKIAPQISEMEDDVFRAFKEHRKNTSFAFGLNLLSGFLVFLKPFIFFYFLKVILKLPQLALVFALTQLLFAFQFTPGSLGIFEVGEVGIYKLIGIEAHQTLAYTLTVRAIDFSQLGIAASFLFHLGAKKIWRKKEK